MTTTTTTCPAWCTTPNASHDRHEATEQGTGWTLTIRQDTTDGTAHLTIRATPELDADGALDDLVDTLRVAVRLALPS